MSNITRIRMKIEEYETAESEQESEREWKQEWVENKN